MCNREVFGVWCTALTACSHCGRRAKRLLASVVRSRNRAEAASTIDEAYQVVASLFLLLKKQIYLIVMS